MVQLSHLYVTAGKTIALTIWNFVGKVMPLFFNTLSRFVIAFLPRRKQASFNFMAVVTIHSDFGTHENKICHCFHFFPVHLPWSDGTGCHDLSFFECWVSSQFFHSPHVIEGIRESSVSFVYTGNTCKPAGLALIWIDGKFIALCEAVKEEWGVDHSHVENFHDSNIFTLKFKWKILRFYSLIYWFVISQ